MTKDDLAAAVAPLATKVEVREEGERTRQHFNAVAERLEDKIQLIAEGQTVLQQQFGEFRAEVTGALTQHDRRIMRLEADRFGRRARKKPQ